MCGFVVSLNSSFKSSEERSKNALESLELMKHRGPDESKVVKSFSGNVFGHTRLAIVAPGKGTQPISHNEKIWVHNGEIYNHHELRTLMRDIPDELSDSAAIGVAFDHYGLDFVNYLDGVFALAIEYFDEDGVAQILVARDPLGVKPLFYGSSESGDLYFASEMKALEKICVSIETFPPGYKYISGKGFFKYYQPTYLKKDIAYTSCVNEVKELISDSLTRAVEKRLMGDVPMGALLSGGLDSSLVAAIAARSLKKKGKILQTFSVGLESSTMDIEKAKLVAEYIGSSHHSITYSVEEGIEAIKDMIYLLEAYDVTTIRASTPMYIMSKHIKSLGIKSVLSGEGADEIFGGYLYFAHAPSAKDFHSECLRRIEGLNKADLLRADRSTMGASVEARVPFLDLSFLEVAMRIDPNLKEINFKGMRPEKWILRESFAHQKILPEEILWRQKEQFSDGVGYEWVDGLKDLAEQLVSDTEFSNRDQLYPFNTPGTKEAFLYRRIFCELFGHKDIERQTDKWIPRWQDYNTDPSGRANKVHESTTEIEPSEVIFEQKRPSMAGK